MKKIQNIKFSINNWGHLYSLQQAISHNKQLTGRKLSITGRIPNSAFLNKIDTAISIDFFQTDSPQSYTLINPDTYELGTINLQNQQITSCIMLDRNVFEEMRKNLMEYGDIEGIHIIVSLDLLSDEPIWEAGIALQIVQLDYAMKGDA